MSKLRIVNETCIGVNNIHWSNFDPIIVREINKLLEENQQLEEKIKELNEELNHYKTENMRLITTNNTNYSYGVR